MTKELRAGISLSEDKTQVAIAELRSDGNDLKYLEEFSREENHSLTYLPDSVLKSLTAMGKLTSLNVSIETTNATIQVFPLDANLPQSTQDEQLDWEWKNYIPDYSPTEYVRKTMVLASNLDEQRKQMFSSVVKQELHREITEAFRKNNLGFQSIELGLETAEQVLRFVYPDMVNRTIALLGISNMRLDVCVFTNGTLSAYKYGLSFSPQTAVDFLANELLEFLPEALYVYGQTVSYEWIKALKSSLGVVVPLNPFRKFRITPDVKNFSRYLGHEHRFCGCVGALLGSRVG